MSHMSEIDMLCQEVIALMGDTDINITRDEAIDAVCAMNDLTPGERRNLIMYVNFELREMMD